MLKLQYLWRAPAAQPVRELGARVLEEIGPRFLDAGATRLKLTLTTGEPPRLSVLPFRRDRVALVSVWVESSSEGDETARWSRLALDLGGPWAAYRVEESLPLEYARDWPDGEATPGVGLLTLLRRRPGLSDEEFLRRWHEGHSPLALRTHPLWCYVRNHVRTTILPGSPPLDAIVEEHFRTEADLLSPPRFFGGPLRMVPNMLRVLLDVRGFLDLGTIENYLVTERWLRS